MNYALSESEINQLMNGKINILTYSDLPKLYNIDQLLGRYKRCILLFLNKANYGHWTCLFLNVENGEETLHFFNSYGNLNKKGLDGYPDEFLKYINKNFRVESHQNYPYLSELMFHSKYPLEYNPVQFQKLDENVKTCGYWCIVRLMYSHMTDKEFENFIFENSKYQKITPDELVVNIIK